MLKSEIPNTANLDAFSFEWESRLCSATKNGAQFALYLAMNEAKSSGFFHIEENENAAEANKLTNEIQQLSCYPKTPTCITDDALLRVLNQSKLRANGQLVDAWFAECAKPTPIHYKDNANDIDEAVVSNCKYASQQVLRSANCAKDVLETNATLLSEIVPLSQSML